MSDFETQIAKIKSHLRHARRNSDEPVRPFIVEIDGSQRAGKSSTIREMDKVLRAEKLKVYAPQENAQAIRHIDRKNVLYNLRTMVYSLQILLDECARGTFDVLILDRGLYDAYAFMYYCELKKMLSEEQRRVHQAFIISPIWFNKIDAACLMVCDAEVAMAREKRAAFSPKMTETTTPEVINQLIGVYKKTYEDLSPNRPQFKWFDTTEMTEKEGSGAVIEYTISTFMRQIEEEERKNK